MENSFNLVSVVMILGAAQGFFLAIFLFMRKREEGALIKFLSMFLLVAALLFLMAAFHQARQTKLLIIFGPIIYPLILSLGPLLYLYIKSALQKDFKFKILDIFYFFPTFFAFAFFARIYFFPYEQQVKFIESFYSHNVTLAETLFRYFDIAYRAVFVILSIKLLSDYRERLKEEYSALENIDYGWLKQLLIYYLITVFVLLAITVMNLDNDYRIILASYLALIMYFIGYRIMTDTSRQNPKIENLTLHGKGKPKEKSKYEKSGLNGEKVSVLKEKLLYEIEKNKIYVDPDLTLKKLAEILGATQNQVSQLINEQFGRNFYEFINGYRVELAKKLLVSEEYKNESVLSIAFDVGFQSKSTFNAVFKKITKTTPSQYRKNNK